MYFCSLSAFGQAQTTGAASAQGTCNAVNTGNSSTVTVTCTSVDKKLADQIGQLVAASNRDGKTLKEISNKVEVLLKELQGQSTIGLVQQAPNGINIGPGAIVPNPQVINTGPPPAHLRFTEDQITEPDGDGNRTLAVHIFTDRSIPGAALGFLLSGDGTIDNRVVLRGAGVTQFDSGGQLMLNGVPVPHSNFLRVNLRSAFASDQELIVPIKSKDSALHVLNVVPVGN